ncbi:MAG: VacJ family lipoprotein [Sphingomonadales bacterium]|nr:VacJ family lipoprotein [Sphingomonadales bacterium]MDE2567542.1 VacJ family lipoprotein [Sphingomonadales bacterium]
MLMPVLALAIQPPQPVAVVQDVAVVASPVPVIPVAQRLAALGAAGSGDRSAALDADGAPAPITVNGRGPAPREDPLMRVNEDSYKAVQVVDDAVVKPASIVYRGLLPGPVRDGLHNVLQNLHEPAVFINFLLQGKPGKAIETLGRFAINTTIGVAGLVDVAKRKPFDLPYRPNGFADTLGFYGVGPGPYLYLPLIGPTTVRDLGGLLLDKAVLPLSVGGMFRNPVYAVSTGVVKSLDERVRFDAELTCLQHAGRPYDTERAVYLARRQAEIDALKGRSNDTSGGAWPTGLEVDGKPCVQPSGAGGRTK